MPYMDDSERKRCMPPQLRSILRSGVVVPAVAVAFILIYVLVKKQLGWLTGFTNAFFIIGTVYLCIAGFCYLHNIMIFKTFGFLFYRFRRFLGAQKQENMPAMTFHDYVAEKDRPINKMDGVPYGITGGVCFAISCALSVAFYL